MIFLSTSIIDDYKVSSYFLVQRSIVQLVQLYSFLRKFEWQKTKNWFLVQLLNVRLGLVPSLTFEYRTRNWFLDQHSNVNLGTGS